MPDTLSELFSGVVVNQDGVPEASNDYITLASQVYQTFALPADHARGAHWPEITGVQIRCGVSALSGSLHVELQHKPRYGSWDADGAGLASAVVGNPAAVDTEVWLTGLFDTAVSLAGIEDAQFRLRLYTGTSLTRVWYVVPNPLGTSGSKAYASDATTALLDTSREYSLCFRVLGAVADSGIDLFGNRYRSVALRKGVPDIDPTSSQDAYWLSSPQPSQFAVVSQYFDMGKETLLDGVLIDPVTPGIYVHAYYCNDGSPGATEETWEERVWVPVPRAHHALRRESFMFPEPISARYLKLEYSHLQARSYPVGGFQRPLTYRKHPKWVLDYFLLAAEDSQDEGRFVARSVAVNYDAYTLAYTYYADDLGRQVDPPPFLTPEDRANVERFVGTRDDLSDVVDASTRAQINTILQPFVYDARIRNTARTLLGESLALDNTGNAYPVESVTTQLPVSNAVSSLDRDAVVFEQSFPVMYFYIPARHRYRYVSASLSHDRAYFAGVREVAFLRERFGVESDLPVYSETLGDFFNADRNDFA